MRRNNQPKSDRGALVCSHCGRVVSRLHAAPYTATIPGGKTVHQGDLICEECLTNLNEEFSEEQTFTRPPS